MTSTELFTRDGKLHCVLEEDDDGTVITQIWSYASDASAFEGAQPGSTEIALFLNDRSTRPAKTEALIDAWRRATSKPGFRSSMRGGEAGAREFLAATHAFGTLWATNRAA